MTDVAAQTAEVSMRRRRGLCWHARRHPTVALGAVIRIYLTGDVWQRVAASITVQNLNAADDVDAQGQMTGALGEGFANSLDLAGF